MIYLYTYLNKLGSSLTRCRLRIFFFFSITESRCCSRPHRLEQGGSFPLNQEERTNTVQSGSIKSNALFSLFFPPQSLEAEKNSHVLILWVEGESMAFALLPLLVIHQSGESHSYSFLFTYIQIMTNLIISYYSFVGIDQSLMILLFA